jgi:hypothetical protein
MNLEEAIEFVRLFFDDDSKTIRWWGTENPQLGGVRPLDMLVLGKKDKLIQFIEEAAENEKHRESFETTTRNIEFISDLGEE